MSKCKTIYFDYTLVLIYSIVSQKSFSITPWSFEDHFIWTQLLHLVAFVFIPLRFYKKAGVSPHQVYRYAFGFLIVHAVSQFISSLFLMPTCSFWYGLRWYFLLEAPSLFLLTSLSLFLIQHCSRRRYIYLWLICFVTFFGLFIVYDLLETPTLFFFHPSIGYYPGPLYDHWIPIPRSLIFASLWSVVAGIFFYMWTRKRQIGFLGFILLLPLLIRSTLGLHQTHQTVQSALPSHYTTQFTQVFSDQALRSSQLQSMDYYIQRISKTIALPLPTNPIKIYIYSDPRQKKRLTGTHLTMIGNPRQRSLHILDFSTWDLLFVHELTHALSSPLRQNILSMPLNPLLTEGLAMYTQKYMGPYNLQQWGKAIVRFRKQTTLANIDQISFYRQPPLHAYGLAGAWIDYLIQTYGIDRYKKYYGGQPFSNVYPSPQHEVEKQWFAWMDQAVLTEEIYNTMLSSLERKSVFEVKCPHEIAHALYKIEQCHDEQPCKGYWEAYAKGCSENYTIPKGYQKPIIKPLGTLLATDIDHYTALQKNKHYIDIAKQYEKIDDFASALTYVEKAMAIVPSEVLAIQRDRLSFLLDGSAKKNPVQTKSPQL